MRSYMVIFALAAGLGLANAQEIKEEQVPPAVKDAFKKEFPDERNAKWEKEGMNYKAEFRADMKENTAVFSENGRVVEKGIEIDNDELPKAASDYISKNLGGKEAKDVMKKTDADGKVTYKAEVGDEYYIFGADGSFIKKKSKEEKMKSKESDKDKDRDRDRDKDLKDKEHHENDMDEDKD